MRYLALGVPGLGPLIADELGGQITGNDGRADVVAVEARGVPFVTRLSEDVLVELTSVATRRPLRDVIGELTTGLGGLALEKSLSVWSQWRRPLSARMTFRVVARLLNEDAFLRSDLRDTLSGQIGQARPAWRPADPADLEFWALEDRPGRLRLGLRLTTSELRHRQGRRVEREGALRPTVAAAMVSLAGPNAALGRVVDPCCGSGTILSEARAAGHQIAGADIDSEALAASRLNLEPAADLWRGDAARMPLADRSVASIITNLPFGHRHKLPDNPARWLSAVVTEAARVAAESIVLLSPASADLDRAATTAGMTMTSMAQLRLLGRRASIWRLSAP